MPAAPQACHARYFPVPDKLPALGQTGACRMHSIKGDPMIIAITRFQLPKPITLDEARKIFLTTAPTYQGVAGLLRKHYFLSPEGDAAGGVYLWNSQAQAEALYTEGWKAFVREKYGTDPSVTYLDSPVAVDNVSNQILSDG